MAAKRFSLIVNTIFSIGFLRYLIERFAYNLYEHVVWRSKMKVGRNVRIHPSASIRYPEHVSLGDHSHININCCIWAETNSRITLGKNLLMGPNVQIHSSHHGTKLGSPMMEQPQVGGDIVIGDDVWLCGGAIITSGVSIANGVVVAANAVVTKNIEEENVIVAGVPAKIVAKRR